MDEIGESDLTEGEGLRAARIHIPDAPGDDVQQIAPASLMRRWGAWFVDLGVIAFSSIPFVAIVEIAGGGFSLRTCFLLAGVIATVGLLYDAIMLAVAGRTVGMRVVGLLALDARQMDLPSAGQAVRHVLASFLGIFLLGPLWALVHRERRTLADRVAGIVIKRVARSIYESQEVYAPWLYRPSRR